MALQQALNRPGIVQQIDAMNELFEGVPASEENLKTLLEYLNKHEVKTSADDAALNVGIADIRQGRKNSKRIHLTFEGPQRQLPDLPFPSRPVLYREFFECSTDGLLKALVTGKRKLKSYREDGSCPNCENRERPRKRLKAERMPLCEECVIKKALQL
jgi:hypothetical protein